MDPLDDAFAAMRVRESLYARVDASAPWAIRFREGKAARFGLVISGTCWLTMEAPERSIPLAAGDCYVILDGSTYTLGDNTRSTPLNCFDVVPKLVDGAVSIGGGGTAATVVTGWFVYDELGARPLMALLPRVLHTRVDGYRTDILKTTLELLAKETERPGLGSGVVISGLADILFVQAIRSHLNNTNEDDVGWLAALSDKRIGAAMRALHGKPADPWTVEKLAVLSNMSRSAFAARFKARLGEAPLEYLTRWRMFRAGVLLRHSERSLAEIANEVGYESDAALSKAFHRVVGMAPGAFRKLNADVSVTPQRAA
ncbi:AraC family transcriptional regulator [Afipia sp. GAS231]|uniref:AraC family transcriptional regulator n=1 Tax=Afipia sp. GAS231 TaxID=1882747 RepID=UPI00087C5AD8|nr:AraC family transcriptional regulator [Afipia sp. GAS231]SDO26843.1 AraC-type DNA-binding protein [Afipia sp. GAS231]